MARCPTTNACGSPHDDRGLNALLNVPGQGAEEGEQHLLLFFTQAKRTQLTIAKGIRSAAPVIARL